MNGVHDLGGMLGFGPVIVEPNEPVFHANWERRVFALSLSSPFFSNLDAARHTIERMPPAEYLGSSYYEHWLHGLELGLIENGTLTREEIEEVQRNPREPGRRAAAAGPTAPTGADVTERVRKARFRVGDSVVARNLNPPGHTRLPRYVRGHRGIIRHDRGVFTFPDSNAHGRGRRPQHCYCVEFSARELWGADRPAAELVFIDLWDDYLDAAGSAPAKRAAKVKRAGRGTAPARAKGAPIQQPRRVARKLVKQTRKPR
jgi:nitrile hydratase